MPVLFSSLKTSIRLFADSDIDGPNILPDVGPPRRYGIVLTPADAIICPIPRLLRKRFRSS